MLFPVHSVNVNGFVVLCLERFTAILARIFAPLNVPRLDMVRNRFKTRAGLVANGAVRLIRHPVELDELPNSAAVI